MEFGIEDNLGKFIRNILVIVRDKNNLFRLEMVRDYFIIV